MTTDIKDSHAGRQELIDLLYRLTKSAKNMITTVDYQHQSNITISDEKSTVEEGEILTIDDDNNEDNANVNVKEIEEGEIAESPASDVCMKTHRSL